MIRMIMLYLYEKYLDRIKTSNDFQIIIVNIPFGSWDAFSVWVGGAVTLKLNQC